jgi:adrenodoxin-NADP+ reductase
MRLETSSDCGQTAVGTGEHETIPADLVLKSIGYRSLPMEGAPFDATRGIIPNTLGCVDGHPGLFVCGWLKRGPTGIIGTNLLDAEQTVDTMVQWQGELPLVEAPVGGAQGLAQLLQERQAPVVSWPVWEKIDAAEVERGAAVGKPREKFTSVEEMLRVA